MITQIMIGWLATFVTAGLIWFFSERINPLRDIKYAMDFCYDSVS
ncbi:hypothetical protein PN471_17775 [Aphanizomenon sp. CS-733/32]|nr:hypothetical protein [Aphanizomenon sp. CS-733/32]MDB9310441.1 hypothetical protein [Aphanizomenon sp. CS-733/32]